MAEGEAERVGGRLGKYLDLADHPLVFAIAMLFMLVPLMALFNALFAWLGWTGPAGLFKHP